MRASLGPYLKVASQLGFRWKPLNSLVREIGRIGWRGSNLKCLAISNGPLGCVQAVLLSVNYRWEVHQCGATCSRRVNDRCIQLADRCLHEAAWVERWVHQFGRLQAPSKVSLWAKLGDNQLTSRTQGDREHHESYFQVCVARSWYEQLTADWAKISWSDSNASAFELVGIGSAQRLHLQDHQTLGWDLQIQY